MAKKDNSNNNPFRVPDLKNLAAKLGNMAPPLFSMPDLHKSPPLGLNLPPIPPRESMREVMEPVYTELSRVTGELTKANDRAELAEQRADIAEGRATIVNWIMGGIAVLAIAIPCLQSWHYNSKSQASDKELKALSSTVRQLSLQVKTLKAEVSKAKTQQRPAMPPSRSSVVTPKAKHP